MDAARFLINTIFIYDMYNNIYYNIMSYKYRHLARTLHRV